VPDEEADCSFKIAAATHSQTQHHFPEDQNPNYTSLKTSKSFLDIWLAVHHSTTLLLLPT